MKIHTLIYDEFAQFEVMLIGWMKANGIELETVSLEKDYVTSVEGFKVIADKKLKDLNPDEVELLLIPGGNTPSMLTNKNLQQFIRDVNSREKTIAAICYGPLLLGEAGVLANKRFTTSVGENEQLFSLFENGSFVDEDVIVDGNIITAKGNAYVEFALEVSKQCHIVKEEHLDFYHRFLKNSKEPSTVNN